MRSVITEVWYGNICPQEDGIFYTSELKELLGYMARHQARLEIWREPRLGIIPLMLAMESYGVRTGHGNIVRNLVIFFKGIFILKN